MVTAVISMRKEHGGGLAIFVTLGGVKQGLLFHRVMKLLNSIMRFFQASF